MSRSVLLLVLGALFACSDQTTTPRRTPPRVPPPTPTLAISAPEETGPPPHYDFGPDTYRIGIFTGQGITRPGLDCEGSTAAGRTCSGFLASSVDGTLLDVLVQVPPGSGRFPLIALIHGYGGSKNTWGDIAQRFVDAGYAILRYSTRGFGESWGLVNLADVNAEIGDLRSMIAQVEDHRFLHLDPDAVAVAGASYGGGHSWLALLQPTFTTPKGQAVRVRTVVPIATWTDLVYSLVPNGRPRESLGVPGALKLTYANGLFVGGIRRNQPSRPYPNYPDYLVTWNAWVNANEPNDIDPIYRQMDDGLDGYRSIWWRDDFWARIAANHVPIFQVQAFTDDLFPLSESLRMLLALQTIDPAYPIASYFGDIGHPRAQNRPAELDYALDLIERWLGHYLRGEGAAPTGIYAGITRPRGVPFNANDVITVPTWQEFATRTITHAFDGEALLVNPLTDPLGGFFWDPFVISNAEELRPYTDVPPAWPEISTSLATYEIGVGELGGGAGFLIAGQPAVRLNATTSSPRVQLDVRLIDVGPDGARELVTRGTYTLENSTPGVPIRVPVVIPTYGNLWSADASHRLRLEITNIDSPYLAPSRIPSATVVSDVSLTLPVR